MREPKPENRTPDQHRLAMISSLEGLVPVIAGAAQGEPPGFFELHPGGCETLTEIGRQFAGVVYRLAVEAHEAAEGASGYMVPAEKELYATADDVRQRMALCVLFARGLMEPDLPPNIYVAESLRRIHREASAAYEALLENEGRSRAVGPKVVAAAHEKESAGVEPPPVATAAGTPEQYTLPRVVEMVRGHAEAIGNAATALDVVEDGDSGLYDLVRERVRRASEELWDLEGEEAGLKRSPELSGRWHKRGEAFDLMQRILWGLPLLDLAVQAARSEAYEIASTVPWLCCSVGADQVAKDLTEWARIQEEWSAKEVN